jgi:type I restriction enzyme M protein
MTNPPFGKKSSTTIVADDGKVARETEIIERDDFWATTSNKQLNFLQHVKNATEAKRPGGDRGS